MSMFEDEPRADPARRGLSAASGPVTPRTPVTLLRIKVVPGSRKDAVVGALGDRLKVKVAAPPEDGKANAAVCALVAAKLGLRERDVTVVSGMTNPEKTLRLEGITAAEAAGRLG